MLSIIIPTLDEEKYLPRLISEIKKQNFEGLEIIVADGGSKDRTPQIAQDFGCKVVEGGSPAKGRNKGAAAAAHDLLLFMDADTIYLPPGFFVKAVEEFKKRELGVAVFPVIIDGGKFDRFVWNIYNFFVKLTQKFLPHISSGGICMASKEVHEKIGGFDEEIKLSEDMEYVRRAAKVRPFGFIDTEPLFTSARRLESDGRLKSYLKYIIAELYMLIFGPIKSDIFHYKFGHYKNKP